MNRSQKIIHMAQHKETGAYIPIIVKKKNENNEVEDYEEYKDHRKGFTLEMLIRRWKKTREEVIQLLNKFQVPGHLNGDKFNTAIEGKLPIDFAFFFEEYISAIEKSTGMPHSKLKSRFYERRN